VCVCVGGGGVHICTYNFTFFVYWYIRNYGSKSTRTCLNNYCFKCPHTMIGLILCARICVWDWHFVDLCKSIYKEFFLARCVTLIETLCFFNVNTYVDICIKICSNWYDDSNIYELILSFPYVTCGKFLSFPDETWKYFCVVWKLMDSLCQNMGQAKNMSATDLFSY